MRMLTLGILVVLGLVLIQAAPTAEERRWRLRLKHGDILKYFRHNQENVYSKKQIPQRERRAACKSDCSTVTQEINGDAFVSCVTIFNHILDGTGLSDTDAQNFCNQKCDTTILAVFEDIQACCGDNGFPSGFDEILSDSCKTNSNGDLCIKDDQYAANMLQNPQSTKGNQFIQCTSDFQQDSTVCPSSCTQQGSDGSPGILTYVANTLGCCYKGVADSFNGPASLASDNLFTVCQLTPPRRCASRQK